MRNTQKASRWIPDEWMILVQYLYCSFILCVFHGAVLIRIEHYVDVWLPSNVDERGSRMRFCCVWKDRDCSRNMWSTHCYTLKTHCRNICFSNITSLVKVPTSSSVENEWNLNGDVGQILRFWTFVVEKMCLVAQVSSTSNTFPSRSLWTRTMLNVVFGARGFRVTDAFPKPSSHIDRLNIPGSLSLRIQKSYTPLIVCTNIVAKHVCFFC